VIVAPLAVDFADAEAAKAQDGAMPPATSHANMPEKRRVRRSVRIGDELDDPLELYESRLWNADLRRQVSEGRAAIVSMHAGMDRASTLHRNNPAHAGQANAITRWQVEHMAVCLHDRARFSSSRARAGLRCHASGRTHEPGSSGGGSEWIIGIHPRRSRLADR